MRAPFFVAATILSGCGSGHAVVTAQPLPSSTTPAPAPSAVGSAAATTSATAPIVSPPPPPPESPIKRFLANPPPAPKVPDRTCPTLPKRATTIAIPGKGSQIIATIRDYLSLKPIADVQVKVFHGDICRREKGCEPSHPHPAEQLKMTGKTDIEGRVTFDVPDLDYAVVIPADAIPGYLPFSNDYNMARRGCHKLDHEWKSSNGRALLYDAYLVPESMLAVRNQDDALAAAMQLPELVAWLRNHQDAELNLRPNANFWDVGFGYKNNNKRLVIVNVFDGTGTMLGRWD